MEQPQYRKRCRRINEAGHAHALTFSCFQRRQFLAKERSCQWLIDAIDQTRYRYGFHLWAYVIMPEHVHLLLWPTQNEYSISQLLYAIKKPVANRAVTWVRRNAPDFLRAMEDSQPDGSKHYRFWLRGGGYDRNIITDGAVWAEISYLHANPVRRGLTLQPIDWNWSNAREYEQPGSGPLSIDKDSLPTRVIS